MSFAGSQRLATIGPKLKSSRHWAAGDADNASAADDDADAADADDADEPVRRWW